MFGAADFHPHPGVPMLPTGKPGDAPVSSGSCAWEALGLTKQVRVHQWWCFGTWGPPGAQGSARSQHQASSCLQEIFLHLSVLVLNAGASPPFLEVMGTAWHIPLSGCSSLQPELCLMWCCFSNHKWHPLPWAILCNVSPSPLAKEREKKSSLKQHQVAGGWMFTLFLYVPWVFPYFSLPLSEEGILLLLPLLPYQTACLSKLCRTRLALLRASSLKILSWQCDSSRYVTLCCCSSFSTQILSNVGREKNKWFNMFLCLLWRCFHKWSVGVILLRKSRHWKITITVKFWKTSVKDQRGHRASQLGRASGHESLSWREPGQDLAVLAEGNTHV